RSSLLMAAVLALCLVANRASAQWVPDGTPICIEPGRQDGQVIVPDGSGGAIIAWQDARNPDDVLGGDIYAQRVTADGAIVQRRGGRSDHRLDGSPQLDRLGGL